MIVSISGFMLSSEEKNLRGSDKRGRQTRAGGANPPNVAGEPLGERVHKFLVLSSRSRWWRSNCGDLLPGGLLEDNMAHLTILRLLIAMICTVSLPTQIWVRRIDGGLHVIAGDGTIYEVSERSGSNGTDGAGARVILVGVWRGVLQEGANRSKGPSEVLVVVLDWAHVHYVAIVISKMRRVGRACLCRV